MTPASSMLLICLTCVSLVACVSRGMPSLVGKWSEIYASNNSRPGGGCTFFKDNTATCSANGLSLNGTWKQVDSSHMILGLGHRHVRVRYSLHGNRLTLHYLGTTPALTEVLVRH